MKNGKAEFIGELSLPPGYAVYLEPIFDAMGGTVTVVFTNGMRLTIEKPLLSEPLRKLDLVPLASHLERHEKTLQTEANPITANFYSVGFARGPEILRLTLNSPKPIVADTVRAAIAVLRSMEPPTDEQIRRAHDRVDVPAS